MKIIIAPDSFKGSLSSARVCEAVTRGIQRVLPRAEIASIPMADGGEGTVRALAASCGGKILRTAVTGPLGERVRAEYGLLGDGRTAVIEMASASGLPLVPEKKRNPLETTTFGTGQLITAALKHGITHLIIGLGGSATNDGGAGMAQALGAVFFNKKNKIIPPPMTGRLLGETASLSLENFAPGAGKLKITAACDVKNPLLGRRGCARVYAAQKGADPQTIRILESGMKNYIDVLEAAVNKKIRKIPGSGAAGGLGAGLTAFMNTVLKPGIDIVMEAVSFRKKIKGADLILTGEGKIDSQTRFGKTVSGVAGAAAEQGIPCVGIAGSVENGIDYKKWGLDSVFSLCNQPMPLEYALSHAAVLIENITEQIIRTFVLLK